MQSGAASRQAVLFLGIVVSALAPGCSSVPVRASAPERTLTVFTLNVWCHPATPGRAERMRGIGRRLAALDPDLVGLQEAFTVEREELLAQLAGTRLQHHVYFPSGVAGSGLLVVSAHPIEAHSFFRFTRNGTPAALRHGDWYAGKGAAHVRVRLPDGSPLHFFDTHFIARYWDESYTEDRLQQGRELFAFVGQEAAGEPAIVVGDLNCRPGSEEYRLATGDGSLVSLLGDGTHIDHILGCGRTFEVLAVTKDPGFDGMLRDGDVKLTDHPLLGCVIRWP